MSMRGHECRAGRAALSTTLMLFVTLALGGCASMGIVWPAKEPRSLADVGPNSILIVGTIEVVPTLNEREREGNVSTGLLNDQDMYANRAMLGFGQDPRKRYEDLRFLINPRLEETFVHAIPRDMPYLLGGQIWLGSNVRARGGTFVIHDQKIIVPGPLRIEAGPNDRAVYIGTIRFTRDEFNEVVNVEVIDQYAQAARTFQQRFGDGVDLRRALIEVPHR